MAEIEVTFEMVINTCFGGFGLSQQAAEKIFRRKGISYTLESIGSRVYPLANGKTVDEIVARNDLDLVAVVREMGKAADGDCAKLEIKSVTVYVSTHSFDGKETIVSSVS
jgi:hypothetical protein